MSDFRPRIHRDVVLDEWLAAQENVSRSVELLVRAHWARYGPCDVVDSMVEDYAPGGAGVSRRRPRPAGRVRAERERPAKPERPAQPAQSSKPVGREEPVESVRPARHAKPVEPVKRAEPAGPARPAQPVQPSKPAASATDSAAALDDLIGSVSISGTLAPLADTGQDAAVPAGAGVAGMDDEALQARREELFARLDMWDGEGMMPLSLDDMEVLTAGMDLTAEPDPFADPGPDERMMR